MGPPAARASAPRLPPITCPGSRCFRHKQGCLPLCGKVCMTQSFQLAFLSTCCLSCSFMACACSLKLLECTILLPCHAWLAVQTAWPVAAGAALEFPDRKPSCWPAFQAISKVPCCLVLALLAPISSFSDRCPKPPLGPQTSPVRCRICW